MEKALRLPLHVVWLRRDLRLVDNAALYAAQQGEVQLLLLFIFDRNILERFSNPADGRLHFIYQQLEKLEQELQGYSSRLLVLHDDPLEAFKKLISEYKPKAVYANRDYEPYARSRDEKVAAWLGDRNIPLQLYKDQVIFERDEILKPDATPYTVFTPYAKKWKTILKPSDLRAYPSEQGLGKLLPISTRSLPELPRWRKGSFDFDISAERLRAYDKKRDFPATSATSRIGIHLRFGSISIRAAVGQARRYSQTWLSELIWREFFMMILHHFPQVENQNFRRKYDSLQWRNDEEEFQKWCLGKTGYALVDAGMRQLVQTGWMHNRVRMLCASFLTKHLLVDWRWGETFFANYLLDYELASNNGNWQWAAGTGCDAAPYFRIFNPELQLKKYDPDLQYVTRWIKDYRPGYLQPIVEHDDARKRALSAYKKALSATASRDA